MDLTTAGSFQCGVPIVIRFTRHPKAMEEKEYLVFPPLLMEQIINSYGPRKRIFLGKIFHLFISKSQLATVK